MFLENMSADLGSRGSNKASSDCPQGFVKVLQFSFMVVQMCIGSQTIG